MKRIAFLILILICVPCWGAADVVRYVDTGAAAGGDGTTSGTANDGHQAYVSLFAWEEAEQADLVTAETKHIVHCNRTNGGGKDTTSCYLYSWTTDATHYPVITQDDFPSDGIYDDSKYVLSVTNDECVYGRINLCKLLNLQIESIETDAGEAAGVVVRSDLATGTVGIVIDSCIIKGVCSGTGSAYGVKSVDGDWTIQNSTIYGFVSGADTNFNAIRMTTSGHVNNVFNCTVYGNFNGVLNGGGTSYASNTTAFNNSDDIYGTVSMSYCATDDGDEDGNNGNITITQTGGTPAYAALVTNAAAGDFSVTDTSSQLYDVGTADIFDEDDDIIGTARPQGDHWDIGAFEYVAEEEPGGQESDLVTFGGAKAAGKSAGKNAGKQD